MDKQVFDVVFYLESHEGASPIQLAEHFGVSERTVRTYVRKANETMRGFAEIQKRRADGYVLCVTDQEDFERWKEGLSPSDESALPSTPDERVIYLLNDLLQRSDWITLDDLSSILYVSRSAISANLKQVERAISRFNLTLEKKPRYGIRISGSEMNKRLCLANNVVERLMQNPRGGSDKTPRLDVIQRCVDEATAADQFQINSAAYQNLLVHISIAVVRVRSGKYVVTGDVPEEALFTKRELAVAHRIADNISHEFDIDLPESEVSYIAIHLAGKQAIYDETLDKGLVISDEVWDVVTRMLEAVWRSYRFDFRNDIELRMNLARHIVPLSVRLRYHLSIDNPLLHDIRLRFPLAYSMAMDASSVLADTYGSRLSDDELGYIALAFALALERQKTEVERKNILIVCASGVGSSKLLEYRYQQEFGDYLNRIVTCDVANLEHVDLTGIDYIITTVPLGRTMPVPVREVKYFLDESDLQGMRRLFSSSKDGAFSLRRFFSEDLFLPHLTCATKDEAIEALCKLVSSKRCVPATFEQLVKTRELSAYTSFGNQVAMPHPSEAVSEETFVCVGILDRHIDWSGTPVRAVFLVSVSNNKHKDLREFYRGMANLLTSKEAIEELVRDQSYSKLLSLLDTYGKSEERN